MVIVVRMALSDCLSGQLLSFICIICFFFVSLLESALSDWHCLVGIVSQFDLCSVSSGVCLTIGSV